MSPKVPRERIHLEEELRRLTREHDLKVGKETFWVKEKEEKGRMLSRTREKLEGQKKLVEDHRRGVRQAEKALGISMREMERIEGDITRLEVRLKDSEDAAVKAAGETKVCGY